MAVAAVFRSRRLPWQYGTQTAVMVALVTGAFVAGAGLVALGAAFGVAAMAVVPAGVLLLSLALHRPWLGLAGFVLVLPIGLAAVPGGLPVPLQLVQLAALLSAAAVLLSQLLSGRPLVRWSPSLAWVLLLVAAALFATPGAVDSALAVKTDITLMLGAVFTLATVTALRGDRDLERIITLFLVVAGGICAYSLKSATQLQAHFGASVVDNRAEGVFQQPNELGAFSALTLFLAFGCALGASSRRARILGTVVATCATGALLLSLSRGAWIGVALAGVFLLKVLPQARKALIRLGPPLLLVAAALGVFQQSTPQLAIVTNRLGSITHPSDNPYDHRPQIYREALREIKTHPLLGVGPGNFPVASTRSSASSSTVSALHAHNVLLTVTAEGGILAAFVVVGLLLAVLSRLLRRRREVQTSAIPMSIAAALVVQVGQGLVDFSYRSPTLSLLLWFLLGLAIVAARGQADRSPA